MTTPGLIEEMADAITEVGKRAHTAKGVARAALAVVIGHLLKRQQPDWTVGDLQTGKCWEGMVRKFARANGIDPDATYLETEGEGRSLANKEGTVNE